MAAKTDLDPRIAEAAHALRGHLEFLASQGVEGLPPPSVAPVAAPPPRQAVKAEVPAPVRPPEKPSAGGEGMPWARHLPPRAESAARPAAPPFASRAASPRPVSPPPAPVAVTPAPAAPSGVEIPRGDAGLKVIQEELGDCKRCKLHSRRTHIVFGVGNPSAEICFVGEGPGADEDLQGEPFVGKAGQLLTQMIKAMGMARSEVYICNVVKCRPPNNRDPEPDEVAACQPFLVKQLRAIQPKVIVTLGKHAAWSLLKSKTPITRLRGSWGTCEGIPLMPTFHPAYLLRDPTQKKPVWEDLKAVLKHLGRTVPGTRE